MSTLASFSTGKHWLRFVSFAILMTLALAAMPTFAAQDGTLLSYSLNAAGCYVDVTFQVQDAGFYAVNFWDDGAFRAGAGDNFAANAIGTVRLTIGGVILQGAAGIGVYLEDAVGLAATATYDADGSAQLWDDPTGTACAAGYTWGASVATTTTLTSSLNPSLVGQAVTFTATVTSSGSGTPTGTITFVLDGGSGIQPAPVLLNNGVATFTTSSLSVGSHTIDASYSGDTTFAASTATMNQQVGIPTTPVVPPTPIPTPTVPPPPPTPLCEDHNFAEGGVVRASTRDGLDYAINCRVLYQNGEPTDWLGGDLYNAGSIGIQGVLDLGVLQAVDIFSPVGRIYFEGGAVFCLRGQGTLIWLAASGIPRHAEIIGSYEVDDFSGFTCVTLFEPGTLVLVTRNPMG